jgi:hypothetical protein
MKPALLLSILVAGLNHAADYNEAEITRMFQDVRVLKANEAPRTAQVGDKLTAVTSVATGAGSRAELRFPDQSLTRLGANSRFTLKGDARTLDLDQGVMLLQVPKGRGGAKVRTASVTAAVTGTTVMFEYMPDGFIKLIVIEGSVDLYFNIAPGKFRSFTPGQMLIMKPDALNIPEPVDVDLKTLLKTSKLINLEEQGMSNELQVNAAVNQQDLRLRRGRLEPTPLSITGRGTLVTLNSRTRNDTRNRGDGRPPPGDGPNGPVGPGEGPSDGPNRELGAAPNVAFINETTRIVTNPHISTNTTQGRIDYVSGRVYEGAVDGSFRSAFGGGDGPVADPGIQAEIDAAGKWALFEFDSALINGTPEVILGARTERTSVENNAPGITNLALATRRDLNVGYSTDFRGVDVPPGTGGGLQDEGDIPLDLDSTGLDRLLLYSENGDVRIRGTGTVVRGIEQDLLVWAAGLQSDVIVEGGIELQGGADVQTHLRLTAGRDVRIKNAAIAADQVTAEAGRDVAFSGAVIAGENALIDVQATRSIRITDSCSLKARSIRITDSSSLKALTSPAALLQLAATTGNIDVVQSTLSSDSAIQITAHRGNINLLNATASADVFKAQTLGTNGWITLGGSDISATTAIELYAEGAGNAGVRFIDNTTLNAPLVNIAGRTVEIIKGKTVESSGTVNVNADNRYFNAPGRGNFARDGQATLPGGGPFSRPAP